MFSYLSNPKLLIQLEDMIPFLCYHSLYHSILLFASPSHLYRELQTGLWLQYEFKGKNNFIVTSTATTFSHMEPSSLCWKIVWITT